MNKIISKEQFSEKVFKFEVEAPLIARSRKAGHFVIVRVDAKGERMPLTIAGADVQKGTITLVVQEVGLSSTKLCQLNAGDYILDVVGPLGQATHIENFGTVVCAGGGVGVAPMLPIIQALKEAGNRVISVLAGRTKDLIILENEVRKSSDEVIIMTDDGSYGNKGLVTEGIESVIKREKVDKCFAIGPAITMKFCCLLTQKYNIPTVSTGNIIRAALKNGTEMGLKAKSYIDAGELVPDNVVIGIIKERLSEPDCKEGYILDGFPRTIPQAVALDDMGFVIDAALSIEVADSEIVKRMSGRRVCEKCGASYHTEYKKPDVEGVCNICGGNLVIRKDDEQETEKNRLNVYHEQTEPLKDFYKSCGKLIEVQGQDEVKDTTRLVLEALENQI